MLYRLNLSIESASYIQLLGTSPANFSGRSLIDKWGEMPCKLVEGELVDFLYCSPGALACTGRVRDILMETLAGEVEFLPIITSSDRCFFIMNVLSVQSCLDVDASSVEMLPSGRIYGINKCILRESCVQAKYLFKIDLLPSYAVFCSDNFRGLVVQHNFTGIIFDPAS